MKSVVHAQPLKSEHVSITNRRVLCEMSQKRFGVQSNFQATLLAAKMGTS